VTGSSSHRFLVWTLCFGAECRALASLWLRSLLSVGRWRHHIVVLGDHHVLSLDHPQVTAVDITRDMEARYGIGSQDWHSFVYHSCKPQIQFYVNLRQYDYALYTDVDVLVNTDRLEALLESKARRFVICAQRDVVPISSDRYFTGRDTLTSDEKRTWSGHAICAGIVGLPTNATGLQFIRDWHDANRAQGFRGSDQANLIALLVRRYARDWEYLGDTVIARRSTPYTETLLHFSDHMHATMRDYYDTVFRLPESRTVRWTLRRWRRRWLVRWVNATVELVAPVLSRSRTARAIGLRLGRYAVARKLVRYVRIGEP
jgi:hypothetical protein